MKYCAANQGVIQRETNKYISVKPWFGRLVIWKSRRIHLQGKGEAEKENMCTQTNTYPIVSRVNRQNWVVYFALYGVERKTRFFCKGCTGGNGCPVAMCLNEERNCFEVYHSAEFDSYRQNLVQSNVCPQDSFTCKLFLSILFSHVHHWYCSNRFMYHRDGTWPQRLFLEC